MCTTRGLNPPRTAFHAREEETSIEPVAATGLEHKAVHSGIGLDHAPCASVGPARVDEVSLPTRALDHRCSERPVDAGKEFDTNARREGAQGLAVDQVTEAVAALDIGENKSSNQYVSGVCRFRALGDRRDAFEKMRDHAAGAYREETGSTWRPRRGSHVSQTAKLTSAAIDARDFLRAREHRANEAHLPDGTLVAVAGGKEARNIDAICTALDRVKERHPDMVLVHGGGPGAERIAARWADNNAVHQVVFRPDWDAHGRAAPFRRNDQLLKLLPKGLVAFPGTGITENLVDKARELGIPVFKVNA